MTKLTGVAHRVNQLYGSTEPDGYDDQKFRKELDDSVLETLATKLKMYPGRPIKGWDHPRHNNSQSSMRVYVEDGYTYEVSVKCIAWPDMKEKN